MTPALLVDRARLEANVAAMAEAMRRAGVALRPHFKTSKSLEVARLQADAGAVGFTCATPAEVDALLEAGHRDLFWAHAPVGPKAALAAEFNRRGRVIVAVDSAELVDGLAPGIPVRIEVDTGLGRTGVAAAEVPALARRIRDRGLELDGVYTFEGQAYTAPDRAAAAVRAAQELVAVAETLRADGIAAPSVSVGSTPGAASAPFVAGVTEARPGTYVFADAGQVRLGSQRLGDCALTVAATVIRVGDAGAVVDAGTKALGSERAPDGTFGIVPEHDGVVAAAWEEHGLITGASGLSVGDVVHIVPNHACITVNMWSRMLAGDETWAVVARR
jgi:D-serine deaminase-like pyridoxal phosphate-dependent protein